MACGKSTNLEPEGPPPCIATIVFNLDRITCSFHTFKLQSRRRRSPARELGARHLHQDASTGKEAETWWGSAEQHHRRRSPPPQTTRSTAPSSPQRRRQATHSHLAMYRRDPWFPRPPAAEAADGGRGNRRIAASELERTRRGKKSPLLL